MRPSFIGLLVCIFVGDAVAQPGDRGNGSLNSFQDCLHCPEMVVILLGSFVMGSPDDELDRETNEGP